MDSAQSPNAAAVNAAYPPLDCRQREIRLLRISTGKENDEITCTSETVRFEEQTCPKFVALSYCWGDPYVTKPITVNGVSMNVTVNLEAALRQLRAFHGTSQDIPSIGWKKEWRATLRKLAFGEAEPLGNPYRLAGTYLWIDGICINQKDREEKNHQVEMMAEIYSSAKQVLIWLGEGDDCSDRLLDWTNSIKGRKYDKRVKELILNSPDFLWLSICMHYRPWWSRIWVLQESVLAQNEPMVVCGSKITTLAMLTHSIGIADNDPVLEQRPSKEIIELLQKSHKEMRKIVSAPPSNLTDVLVVAALRGALLGGLRKAKIHEKTFVTIFNLLSSTLFHEATNPRDKIYALLGMINRDERSKIPVNYNLEPRELLWKTVIAVRDTTALDLELWIRHTHEPNARTPSWVPDLNQTVRFSMLGYRADFKWQPESSYQMSDDGMFLSQLGTMLDTVDMVQVLDFDFYENQEELQHLDCITRAARGRELAEDHPLFSLQLQRSRDEQPVWKVLLLNKSIPSFANSLEPRSEDLHAEVWKSLVWGKTLQRPKEPNDLNIFSEWWRTPEARLRLFAEECKTNAGGKAFFITKGGFMGVGPREIQADDVLAILHGALVVVALRPRPDGIHTVVGISYLSHVSRNFERLKPLYKKGKLKDEMFKIG